MTSWLSRVPVRLSATAVSIGVCIALLVGVATAAAQQTGPPVNAAPPVLKGKTRDGAKLKVTNGDWTGAKPTYTYSWERCNSSGGECEPIAGAATNKVRLTPADVGHRLIGTVHASNGEGSGEASSAPSAVIAAVAPKHKGRVATTGEPVDGRVLSVANGTWKGTPPFTYTYQWTRCGGGCTPIPGATSSTYRATTADIGKKLYATITAKNQAGSGSQRSKPTTKVVAGSPLNLALPRVSGTPLVGQTLTAEDGTWVGTPPITYTHQWYACSLSGCEAIPGETEPTHTVGIGEFGDGFKVEVTATNAQGSASALSEESSVAGGNTPVNTELPAVSGEAKEGQLLTASSGKWSGTEPITFEYEWLRCNTSGAECTQAAGASALPTYPVVAADVGHKLRVKVIAKNLAGTGEAESEPTATVAGIAPSNVVAPLALGLAITGQTLTATEGTWTGTAPITYTYRWQQCSKAGTECADISGASESKYKIVNGDAGHTLRVVVTAKNVAGTAEKESAATTEVLGVGPTNSEAPAISGEAKEGQVLTASSGKWSGTEPITFEYEWLRCNTSGAECTQAAGASVLPTYSVAAADVGHKLRVKVIAKNIAGTGEAESAASATVAGNAPANVLAPLVTGLAITGQTLTATEGTWTGTAPITYTYRWQQCSKAGTECADISGASESKYKIANGDAGHTLRVVVTAKNVAGTTEKESATTTEVLGVGPTNNEAPAVSGEAKEGQLLTASSGKWSGTEPITFEYEWLRCNTSGAECTQAAGASVLPTYSVVAADVGHKLRVKVIAKNIAGTGEAESAATATVAGIKPANTLAPLVTGLAITGQTLSASEGTWTGTAPISYAYRWQQCSKAGTECADISGASESKYKIANGDAGHTLRVVVTATNVAGSTEKESATTTEVLGVGPTNTEAPKVSGEAKEGQLLTASSGKWSGTEPITFEYEWLRCNTSGTGCSTVSGASVLPTYLVAAADVGKTLRAKVIAKNIAGTASAESAATEIVKGVLPTNTVAPVTVPLVSTTSGSTVTATEGTWTGTQPITYVWEWKICTSPTVCKVEQKEAKNSFKVPAGSGGKKLRVNVIATNAAGEAAKEALELSILL